MLNTDSCGEHRSFAPGFLDRQQPNAIVALRRDAGQVGKHTVGEPGDEGPGGIPDTKDWCGKRHKPMCAFAAAAFLDETVTIGGITASEASFRETVTEPGGTVGEQAFPVSNEEEALVKRNLYAEGGEDTAIKEAGGKAEKQPGEGEMNDRPTENVQGDVFVSMSERVFDPLLSGI